jgi:hypothetical protein
MGPNPGPDHEYVTPAVAEPERLRVAPAHIGLGVAEAVMPDGATEEIVNPAVLDVAVRLDEVHVVIQR